MKKILTALALVAAVGAATAAEVGVSAVRDYNVDKDGVRATVALGKATVSATSIDNVYNRFGVGTGVDLVKIGPVKVGATGAAVYQDTAGTGENGYGLTAGLKATLPLAKNVDLTAGVERFVGQARVNQYNGTVGAVGVALRF